MKANGSPLAFFVVVSLPACGGFMGVPTDFGDRPAGCSGWGFALSGAFFSPVRLGRLRAKSASG